MGLSESGSAVKEKGIVVSGITVGNCLARGKSKPVVGTCHKALECIVVVGVALVGFLFGRRSGSLFVRDYDPVRLS